MDQREKRRYFVSVITSQLVFREREKKEEKEKNKANRTWEIRENNIFFFVLMSRLFKKWKIRETKLIKEKTLNYWVGEKKIREKIIIIFY